MDAIQNFRNDSLNILFLLEIYEAVLDALAAGRPVDCEHLSCLLELLQVRCQLHEGKMGRVFLPALGGSGVHELKMHSAEMLLSHRLARGYLRLCSEALIHIRDGEKHDCIAFVKASRDYVSFLRKRISLFHTRLLPLAERTLSPDCLKNIMAHLEAMDRKVLGNGRDNGVRRMVGRLARIYMAIGSSRHKSMGRLAPGDGSGERETAAPNPCFPCETSGHSVWDHAPWQSEPFHEPACEPADTRNE